MRQNVILQISRRFKTLLFFYMFWPAAELATRAKKKAGGPGFLAFYLLQVVLAGGNRTACHFNNQMRPIGWGCMDILHQPVFRDAYSIQGF